MDTVTELVRMAANGDQEGLRNMLLSVSQRDWKPTEVINIGELRDIKGSAAS